MNKHFTFIDLFSGIGGFRLALDGLGGQCINFSEIHADAITTYCNNFKENSYLNLGDITKLKRLPDHDILTAGVPCQSWSIAGKNLGFDDDRGQLWNDTIYLLNQSRPKAFIFENVKGLADPRNQSALSYILTRIHQAGYHAKHFVLNSSDYGVPQDRVRVYIVGFQQEAFLHRFNLPASHKSRLKLADVLQEDISSPPDIRRGTVTDLFGHPVNENRRYRKLNGMNDFFLFNDIRNGPTTIHSWDLRITSERQKHICLLMLRNRRKRTYGKLDGNPMSLQHLQELDSSIKKNELSTLLDLGILKTVDYSYAVKAYMHLTLTQEEQIVLRHVNAGEITLDSLKECLDLKKTNTSLDKIIANLIAKAVLVCTETRYEFRYTKISTGIDGINRIFLPKSEAFPTLVASDTNDYIALKDVEADTEEAYKQVFLREILQPKLFRKISCQEACLIQGFPKDFKLPESRSRWMKMIGNSVSVPVIQMLGQAILDTGCLSSPVTQKMAA